MAEDGEKLYYTIGEVAEHLGVNRSLIRYWEKEFPMVDPRKNRKGERFFTQKEIQQLELIQHLVKQKGLTLKGAKKQLQLKAGETERKHEAIGRLKTLKAELQEWKRTLSEKKDQETGQ